MDVRVVPWQYSQTCPVHIKFMGKPGVVSRVFIVLRIYLTIHSMPAISYNNACWSLSWLLTKCKPVNKQSLRCVDKGTLMEKDLEKAPTSLRYQMIELNSP